MVKSSSVFMNSKKMFVCVHYYIFCIFSKISCTPGHDEVCHVERDGKSREGRKVNVFSLVL